MQRLTKVPLQEMKYYWFTFGEVNGVHCLIARTGYTGEDGFEIYFEPVHSEKLWNDLLDAGKADGLIPAASARATRCAWKRACASTATVSETTTPWEAGLGWICKLAKGNFMGRDVIALQKEHGLKRTLHRV